MTIIRALMSTIVLTHGAAPTRNIVPTLRTALSITLLISITACSTRTSLIEPNAANAATEFNQCQPLGVLTQPHFNNEITILSWNIYKGKKPRWSQDLLRLSQNTHIIMLQEAALELMPPTPTYTSIDFSPGYKERELQTGVLTASHYKSTKTCQLQHQEPWLKTPKASLITYYPIVGSKQSLLIANIHAINFTLGIKAYQKQLSSIANIISQHPGPAIVGGDLNSWNVRRNKAMNRTFMALNLRRVVFQEKHQTMFMGYPLDQVFYRGLIVQAQTVHNLETSDHNPLQVTFKIPARKQLSD